MTKHKVGSMLFLIASPEGLGTTGRVCGPQCNAVISSLLTLEVPGSRPGPAALAGGQSFGFRLQTTSAGFLSRSTPSGWRWTPIVLSPSALEYSISYAQLSELWTARIDRIG